LAKLKEKQRDAPGSGPSAALGGSQKDRDVALEVIRLVSPVCTAEGLELIQVQYRRESAGRVLRLYIDKPGGIALADCADLSRQVGDLLEVSLETLGPHSLEVSSPGVERPLVKPEDFDRFKGNRAQVHLERPMDGRKKFTGTLLGMTDGAVRLMVDNREVVLPYGAIARARLAVAM
jgi:ribosome maturation factor RimP